MVSDEEIEEHALPEPDEAEGHERLKWGLVALLVVLLAAGALVVVFLGGPILQGKRLRFLRYKEDAAAFLTEGEFGKAIAMYKKALSLKPKDLEVRRLIADSTLRSGDLPEAIAEYHRCLGMRPDDAPTQLTLASLYLLKKDIRHARDIIDAVLEDEPDNVLALTMEAQCHYEHSDTRHPIIDVRMITGILPATFSRYDLDAPAESVRASPEYEKELLEAAKANPDKVQPHKNLADFYRHQKRYDEAEQEYNKMAEIAPRDPDVHLHLADFYRSPDVGRFPEAIRQYSRILSNINSKNLFALRGIAGLSIATGDVTSATRYVDRLLWEQSSDIFGRYFRGILGIYADKISGAERDFLFVTKENPTYAPAHFLLGYAYLLNHALGEARKSLEQATKDLSFGRPRLFLAEIALDLGEYDAALSILDKLPEKEKDNPLAHLLRGRVHITQNDPTQAEAPFTKLAQLDEQGIYPKLLLGEVYKRTARNDQAVQQYKLAIEADSESPFPRYLLGLLYESMGEPVFSMSNYEEALGKNPNFVVAARSLADAYVKSGGESADARAARAMATALGQRLLEKFPNNFALLDTLSTVFYERREFDKAIIVLELILEKERDAHLKMVYHYGMALLGSSRKAESDKNPEEAARRKEDARRELEKAARLQRRNPGHEEIQEVLDQIYHEGSTG